jgi:hypothetical protein
MSRKGPVGMLMDKPLSVQELVEEGVADEPTNELIHNVGVLGAYLVWMRGLPQLAALRKLKGEVEVRGGEGFKQLLMTAGELIRARAQGEGKRRYALAMMPVDEKGDRDGRAERRRYGLKERGGNAFLGGLLDEITLDIPPVAKAPQGQTRTGRRAGVVQRPSFGWTPAQVDPKGQMYGDAADMSDSQFKDAQANSRSGTSSFSSTSSDGSGTHGVSRAPSRRRRRSSSTISASSSASGGSSSDPNSTHSSPLSLMRPDSLPPPLLEPESMRPDSLPPPLVEPESTSSWWDALKPLQSLVRRRN